MAGGATASQKARWRGLHHKGETGDTQLFFRLDVYERYRCALDAQVAVISGQARQRDGECVTEIAIENAISVSVNMPAGHD